MRRLHPAEHRLLAAALAATAFVLFYLAVIDPWLVEPEIEISQQMDELRDTAQRYAGLLAQKSLLQQRSAGMEAQQQRDPLLLAGTDPTQVSADLVDRLSTMISAHATEGAGCDVIDKTPIPGEADGTTFLRVKVNLGLDCGIEPLAHLLADIQQAKPYLFIDSLSISRGDTAPLHGPAGKLHLQLTVAGYMRTPHLPHNTALNAATPGGSSALAVQTGLQSPAQATLPSPVQSTGQSSALSSPASSSTQTLAPPSPQESSQNPGQSPDQDAPTGVEQDTGASK